MNDDESTVGTVLTSEESCASDCSPVDLTGHSRRKAKVHFKLESNEVFLVTHIDDMTDEEVNEIWYEAAEYDAIKSKIVPILRKLMKGVEIEETNRTSVRGLECRSRQGAARRQQNKKLGAGAVLTEQARQRAENKTNDELIRQAFLKITVERQESARAYGIQDEEFIRKDLEKMRKKYNAPSSSSKKASRGLRVGKKTKKTAKDKKVGSSLAAARVSV